MPSADEPARVALPAKLDVTVAAPLAAELLGLRRRPVALDASQVEHLGGLCLQVLLAARATWRADDTPLGVLHASTAFDEALALFGAPAFEISPGSGA